jgi:catechol 2,3-dioxygenase-like lactoylglutathione lyase family enzyme
VPEDSARTASAVSGINHLALTSGDIDRLADFYVGVFGAEVLARSEGAPRKCVIGLAPGTNLHVFEVGPDQARTPDDPPFDRGSISHFALEARDPERFVEVRERLVAAGRSDGAVYEQQGLYTLFATDPDGLFVEWVVPKVAGWQPPFATSPFVGMGQPAAAGDPGGR